MSDRGRDLHSETNFDEYNLVIKQQLTRSQYHRDVWWIELLTARVKVLTSLNSIANAFNIFNTSENVWSDSGEERIQRWVIVGRSSERRASSTLSCRTPTPGRFSSLSDEQSCCGMTYLERSQEHKAQLIDRIIFFHTELFSRDDDCVDAVDNSSEILAERNEHEASASERFRSREATGA